MTAKELYQQMREEWLLEARKAGHNEHTIATGAVLFDAGAMSAMSVLAKCDPKTVADCKTIIAALCKELMGDSLWNWSSPN